MGDTASALVLLADGFEDIEAVAVIDILRRGGVDVVTASVGEGTSVRSAHGIEFMADALLTDVAARDFDALVLPGGGLGTENLKASPTVLELVRRQRTAGRLLAAICAAPTVLSRAGVLDADSKVTCYPGCESGLTVPSLGTSCVVDGKLITGRAPGSAIEFSLAVLSALMGEDVAHQVAAGMVTEG